ncbi:MAG: serine/threonine-protein kinase [Caldimonas sp.]
MNAPAGDGGDRTTVRPLSKRATPVQLSHVLPPGTRLRDYEITDLIGEGGFGVVYLAWDHSLQRKIAVKEYMPASIASRLNGSSAIAVKSDRHLDTFGAGLKSFVNEARLLARFDHPSLVKVYRFWEENGTAYMAMPFYEGPTLKAALAELGHVPSEAELRRWLAPLLDALAVMHAAQCYHRDISPDNILLTPTGPLLLDFGAARRVIGDMTHALTVVLKPGYAPIEQYGDVATMAQGPWTDLYALACVVYYAITGKTPMSSVERLMDDRLEPLSVAAAGRYSHAFLSAIDLALAVRPQDRPQNERQFRDLLDADQPVACVPPPPAGPPPRRQPVAVTGDPRGSTAPGTLTPVLATPVAARPEPMPSPAVAARAPVKPASRRGWLVGLGVLTVVVIGAVFGWLQPRNETVVVPGPTPSASAVESSAATSASTRGKTALPTQVSAPMTATPTASAAASMAEPSATFEAPTPAPAPVQLPVPPRPRRETPAVRVEPSLPNEPVAVPRPAPPRGTGARCSDILQKASLEPLTAEEAVYLKRECR